MPQFSFTGYGKRLTRAERKGFKRYDANATNPMMNLYLRPCECGGYYLTTEVKLLTYIFTFVPIHLTQLVFCVWDGGLKTFEISRRTVTAKYLPCGSAHSKIADDIFSKRGWQTPYPMV